MLMTQTEYAAHIGKTKQYVNKLVRQGKITLVDGKVDRDAADAALRAAADPARRLSAASPHQPAGDDDGYDDAPAPKRNGTSYHDARTANALIQAQLAKIELETKRGNLVEKEKVQREAYEHASMVRDRWRRRDDDIVDELVTLTDPREIKALLDRTRNKAQAEIEQDVRRSIEDL